MVENNAEALRQLIRIPLRNLRKASVKFYFFHHLVTCIDTTVAVEETHPHQRQTLESVRDNLRAKGFNAFCIHDLDSLFDDHSPTVTEVAAVSNAISIVRTASCEPIVSDTTADIVENIHHSSATDSPDIRIGYFEASDYSGDKTLDSLLTDHCSLPDDAIQGYAGSSKLCDRVWSHSKNTYMEESSGYISQTPGIDYEFSRDWMKILQES